MQLNTTLMKNFRINRRPTILVLNRVFLSAGNTQSISCDASLFSEHLHYSFKYKNMLQPRKMTVKSGMVHDKKKSLTIYQAK